MHFEFDLSRSDGKLCVSCTSHCPECHRSVSTVVSSDLAELPAQSSCTLCSASVAWDWEAARREAFLYFDATLKRMAVQPNPEYRPILPPYLQAQAHMASRKVRFLAALQRLGLGKKQLRCLGVYAVWNFFKKLKKNSLGRNSESSEVPGEQKVLSLMPYGLRVEDAQFLRDIVLALRPIGAVRFGILYSIPIGNFLGTTILYLKERSAGVHDATLDYFSVDYSGFLSNPYYAKHLERYMSITPIAFQLAHMFPHESSNGSFCSRSEHAFQLTKTYDNSNIDSIISEFSLKFTDAESYLARSSIENMGIPVGAPFICLQVRDDGYYGEADGANFRNVNIELFKKSVEYLTEQGYYVLRMGAHAQKKLDWKIDKFIDYAQRYRTEFMDIWLYANAYLTVSTGTGPDMLPVVASLPMLYVSFVQLFTMPAANCNASVSFASVCREGANVPLSELLAKVFYGVQHLKENGYQVAHSSAEDILEAVKEKVFLMQGGNISEKHACLQKYFTVLFDKVTGSLQQTSSHYPYAKEPLHGSCKALISYASLKRYEKELLSVQVAQ